MITSSFPRFKGDFFGPWILEYCKELRNQGAEVFVVAPRVLNAPKTILSEENLHITRFDYFPTKLQDLVSPPGIIPNIVENKYLLAALPSLFLQYYLTSYKIIKRYDIDIIHSQWAIPSGLVGALLAKKFDIPHFITTQGAEFYLSHYNPLTFLTKWAIRQSELVLPVSNMMKDRAKKLGVPENKLEVVPNAVNVDYFKPKPNSFRDNHDIPDDAFIILTIRRLVHEKRVQDVIRAFERLEDQNSYLVIAGDGPERDYLEELVDDLQLTDRVIFLGFVDNDKLDRIYPAANVYILSSQQEGLSLSMLEAMASEVITISTGGTGGNDVLVDGKNGFLYPVGDVSSLAKVLTNIINMNEEKKLQIAKEGRNTVKENFSTRVMVEDLLTKYKNAFQ